ncbi:MAG TPA: hypothetical protein VNW90_19225 [Acetobacteraceae bacterium]|jgi:hypothetical protein|nr:hypothetical protein [Acetobacteraceae bacterium]
MTDQIHIIEDGTAMGDIVTSLKALIAAGRGDERVEFMGELKGELNEGGLKLKGSVHQVYPVVLQFARKETLRFITNLTETMEKVAFALSSENRAIVADIDPITPATEAQIQAWLAKAGAEAVALRRELLPSGEFAAELETLDGMIAGIASLIHEPLDQRESGAGKVRVLDERRVARDANEVRDLPLAAKIQRTAKQRDDLVAGLPGRGGDPDLHKQAQELNEDAKDLIRQITGRPILKAVEDILEEAFPGMIRAFYPKVYEHTGRYHSPRNMAVMIANVVAEMLRYGYHRSATAYRLMMPGLAYMREHRMPMFFLAPDLLEAVLRTDFDNDIDWLDLDLPYESGMLMLPKGALVHPKDGEVAMLMWSRVRKGDNPSPWPGIPASVLPNDSFVMLGACPDTMIWYDSILTANRRRTLRLNNLFYRAPGEAAPKVEKSNFMDSDLTELDSEFLEKMGVILFGTILAMNARPQLVEKGKLVKRVGKAEKAREFWTPNVIGARYKFKREVARIADGQFVTGARATGTHASPRLHWRRGHYRNQPVGVGRKERKIIWLEPCLIGAE